MKKIKVRFKKGITRLLAVVMIAGMSQSMTSISQVMASGVADSSSFVEKEDLMNRKTGRIIFGKNEKGSAQEWYLVGKDDKISGKNVVIVAANPMKKGQVFKNEGKRNEKDSELWKDCIYADESNITEVHPNHYGASDLRTTLKGMLDGNIYFSEAEKALLNATKVTTYDTRNRVDYTTTDKLYPLANVGGKLMAGSDDSVEVKVSETDFFWLRTPNGLMDSKGNILTANAKNTKTSVSVEFSRAIVPASNLDVSSVLFASSASSEKSGQIDENAAMVLRMDGSNKSIGNVQYDKKTGNVAVKLDESAKNPVSVVVLGKGVINGKNCDWYYTKGIQESTTVTSEMIQDELKITSDIFLEDCKIWVESTDSAENLTYAKMATSGEVPDIIPPSGGEDDVKKPAEADGSTTGTGDHAPIIGLICFAGLSMIVIVVVCYARNKKRKNGI